MAAVSANVSKNFFLRNSPGRTFCREETQTTKQFEISLSRYRNYFFDTHCLVSWARESERVEEEKVEETEISKNRRFLESYDETSDARNSIVAHCLFFFRLLLKNYSLMIVSIIDWSFHYRDDALSTHRTLREYKNRDLSVSQTDGIKFHW